MHVRRTVRPGERQFDGIKTIEEAPADFRGKEQNGEHCTGFDFHMTVRAAGPSACDAET